MSVRRSSRESSREGKGAESAFAGKGLVDKAMDRGEASRILNRVARALSSIHCYGRDAEIPHTDAEVLRALEAADKQDGFLRRDIDTISSYSESEEVCAAARHELESNPIGSLITAMDSGLAISELIDTLKVLLESGAEVDERDANGKTVLLKASGGSSVTIVKLLLDNGAQIDAKDHSDWTPLRAACHNGQVEVAELLLKKGADPNVLAFDATVMRSTFNLYKPTSPIMRLLARYGGRMEP